MIKCTIAIPVYNRLCLVRLALDSALAQKVTGLEILVVDNHSTDGTWETLQTYRDSRIRLVRNEENVGLFGNFNRCLALARGTYLRFLCSDDRLMPGCLENEIRIMNAHPSVVLLSTAGQFVDESGEAKERLAHEFRPGIYPGLQAIQSWFQFFSRYGRNPFNYPSGVLFRREVACRAGGFDTSMRLAGDINFYLRVLEHGDLAISDAVGCEIMLHEQQAQVGANLSGAGMREHLANLEHYRGLLEQQGGYRRIRRQLAGVIMSEIYKYWRKGQRAAVLTHFEILRESGVGWLAAGATFLQLRILRRFSRAAGIGQNCPEPIRPL